ncbi:hypothetical protein LG293_17785 (plasmid) [Citricoccus nitrophenolicus]
MSQHQSPEHQEERDMQKSTLKRVTIGAAAALTTGALLAGASVVAATAQPSTSPGTASAVEAYSVAALLAAAQADYSQMATHDGRTDYALTLDELERRGALPEGLTAERAEAAALQITVAGSVDSGGESFTGSTTAEDGTVYAVSNLSFAPTTG